MHTFANWKLGGPYILRNVSHAQKENQRTHMEEIFNKIKIVYKEMGFALYRDLYQLLMIRISKDCFNVKKLRPVPRLLQRSKEISVTILHFF